MLNMDDAPRDGTVITAFCNGDPCLAAWSENRVCMLGPRAGECGPGWATASGETDNNLPMDEPDGWEPVDPPLPKLRR